MPPRISACVATVRPDTLPHTIASLQRQTFDGWELILAGQGPDPALRAAGEQAAAADQRIRYLHLDRRGVSLARNAAFAAATAEILAVTDDDCEAAPDWLENIARCFDQDPALGLVGGPLRRPPGLRGFLVRCPSIEPAEATYDPAASNRTAPDGWEWVTANFACRRDVIDRAGPFDEYLGPGSVFRACEDTDYKLRLEALGVRMRSTPSVVVTHTHGARSGIRAVLNITGAYATGNGALAGKLTLMGDPRGKQWLDANRRAALRRLPLGARHLALYYRAYRACLNHYTIDPHHPLLRPLLRPR